jgi:magnesium-protoporphyrin O-methyltransferase
VTCRQCRGIETFFDEKETRGDLRSYRKKGPAKTTQMLFDAIEAEGIEGLTLLDIGGGVGAVQHALLRAGAAGVVSVDASTAYIQAAEGEAQRQGHSDRVTRHHADFVAIAPTIEPADVVTLDRVICCYHDMEGLVGLSSQRAARVYGVVYPRDTWAARMAVGVMNLYMRLRRNPFRVFVHPTSEVDAIVRRNGLAPRFQRKTLVWQVVVYTRPQA